jgi:transposase
MSKLLLSDALWAVVEALLPAEPPKPTGGRPRLADRAALTGMVFVLCSGSGWERLPRALGWGSGLTGWRRLHACADSTRNTGGCVIL